MGYGHKHFKASIPVCGQIQPSDWLIIAESCLSVPSDWLIIAESCLSVLYPITRCSRHERYLGMWADDLRCGPGMIVSSTGTYCEATFAAGNIAVSHHTLLGLLSCSLLMSVVVSLSVTTLNS